jgi:chemotaxis protein methyltransferase CheR
MDFNNIQRLTEEEFNNFAKLIYDESGIFLKPTKITLLSNRLRKRLTNLNISNFSDYYKYVVSLTDKTKEIEALLDVVSTNETYFFRNERHFEALVNKVFPTLSETKTDKKLTIWSAGCSTGEEPYTLSICVNENLNLFPDWKIEIIASDIAFSVLDFARVGHYSGRRIEKVRPDYLEKYFKKLPKEDEFRETSYEVKESLRKLVTFKQLNLFKDHFPVDVDVIFCRNVMIYFDRTHQSKLIKNFYNSISKDNGYLFIGHSETLHSISDDFFYVKLLDAPVYIPSDRRSEFKRN